MPDTGTQGRAPDEERAIPAARILLVEDEPSLVLTLRDRLVANGYHVESCGDGQSALALANRKPFDLVILDVMLPGMDGLDVCRELRRRGMELPILMLTARSQVVDKVVGLKLGADDYVTKPFEMMELLARVEAMLRRGRGPLLLTGEGVFCFGDIRVDFKRAEVCRNGEVIALSAMEYRLLRHFVENRGAVISRDKLLDHVWGYDATAFSRTVDVHVASLRQKIEPSPQHPRFIITVHRLGYRFDG
ncbi:MAG: response regulator transcription factor [Acidobacteria bacterium]|nr:response regulator transcription factor [Acidobacteriota bacterium]